MINSNNDLDYDEKCPFLDVQKIVTGKWTMVIIFLLKNEPLRFSELSRRLTQVSQASLTKDLRNMERYGLVHREVYREVPPRVEYSLTDCGRGLLPVISALTDWSEQYRKAMQK